VRLIQFGNLIKLHSFNEFKGVANATYT